MRRRARSGRCAIVAAVITAQPALASAQPSATAAARRDHRLDFRSLADPTCPSEPSFRDDVASLVHQKQDVFDAGGRHVVRVTVSRSTQTTRYEAAVELARPDGTLHPRTPIRYEGLDCWFVTRQAAMAATALLSDPDPSPPPAAPAAPAPECDAACIAKRVAEAEREAYERGRLAGRKERQEEMTAEIDAAIDRRLAKLGLPSRRPPDQPPHMTWPFAVSAGGVVSLGFALDVAPGVAIGAEWRPAEMFSIGVEGRYIAPATVAEFGVTPIKLPASIISGLVVPCFRWKVVVGCAVAELGALYFDQGGEEPDAWRLRTAVGPRAGIDIPFLERFSVRVLGDLLFAPEIELPADEGGRLYRTPLVSGFVTAGFSIGF